MSPANVEVGDVILDDKPYRIDILSYRGRDIIDFAPRASVPTGSVVMSDLGLYQPLVQTDWKHGNGFMWYSDALGYMRTDGNVDTRQSELAMLYTKALSSDTDNNRKDGHCVFKGNLYTYGINGVRKFDGANWSAVNLLRTTQGESFSSSGALGTLTIGNVEVQDSTNPVLLVSIHVKTNVTVSSITYGGVSMGAAYDTSGTAPKTLLFKLVAPTPGVADVVITFSGAAIAVAVALPLYNVDQTTPLGATMKESIAAGTSASLSYTSAARRQVIDIITLNNVTLPSATSPAALVLQNFLTSVSGSMGISDGSSPVVTGWTWSGATKAEHIAVEVNYVSTDPQVNFLISDGDYLFALLNGTRLMKSTDGITWTVAGVDPGASDFKWAIMHNGFMYMGKDGTNQIHYSSAVDLSDMEGTISDPGTIYCGIGGIPTICAQVYAGNLYALRQDGVWQITDDNLARKMVDYSNEVSSDNLLSACVTNGYMMFPVRDRVIQWNGARVSDITPEKINDLFPYTTYGTFACFFATDNFMYCIGKTNEVPYKISLLCWDGVGWHKLSDLVTNGTDVISYMDYDVVNNRIWYHLDSTSDVTYYIQLSDNSQFAYPNFPTSGTHSLISSRYDMGFRRAIKSTTSLWVEAENVTAYRYLDFYYQIDGDGIWHHWDKVTNPGITMLEFPGGIRTVENFYMQIRVDFITNNAAESPILDSYTLRFIMRPDTKMGYNFNILSATNYKSATVEDDRSSAQIVQDIRDLRNSKKPIKMVDILGNELWGYITAIREQPIYIHSANEQDVMDVEYFLNVNFAEC